MRLASSSIIAAAFAIQGCAVGDRQRNSADALGFFAAEYGPLRVRGVTADPLNDALYVSLCPQTACGVYRAGPNGSMSILAQEDGFDFSWISLAPGSSEMLAVRTMVGAEFSASNVSEVVSIDRNTGEVTVVHSQPGIITSLHAFQDGSYAYLASTSTAKVNGCLVNCRYVPTELTMIMRRADGSVLDVETGIVDGAVGEKFMPVNGTTAVAFLWDPTRTLRKRVVITSRSVDAISVWETSEKLVARVRDLTDVRLDQPLDRFDPLQAPFTSLGQVRAPGTTDFTSQSEAVAVSPAYGSQADNVVIHRFRRQGSNSWMATSSIRYRLPSDVT